MALDFLHALTGGAPAPETPQYDPGSFLLSLVKSTQQRSGPTGARSAPHGSVGGPLEEQLRQGFLAAGRPDLARMVGRPSFDTWVGQESGGNPYAVSPANNQGQRNGGLFQFWYGHDFTDPYEGAGKFTMSPYDQAYNAATQFDLDPGDIKSYARSIRRGDYEGWG